ncbi:MAG: peptide chain release factor N(5)-glutamine methyltransferase [Alphaproteobacteria bacterium]
MNDSATVRGALDAAAGTLRAAGLPEARREAQVLLGHALGGGRETVIGHPERRLSAAERAAFATLVARRRAREPAAYILGEREFWSLPFGVSRDTLIPRPDSETVVETALAFADRDAPLRLLDLGAGSGCLLLALLSELPHAGGIGVDLSAGALATARDNAARLGLAERARFVRGDWGRALGGRFDLIVANPPYIAAADLDGLAPEVARFEPRTALSPGADGLAGYRALAPDVARLLAADGLAVIEVGDGQAGRVAAIMAARRLDEVARRRDLAGIERCLCFRRREIIAGFGKKLLGNRASVG